MFHHFCTLEREVAIQGIGLHCGQLINLRLCPSAEVGICFVRTDLPNQSPIAADIARVSTTVHATLLEEGPIRVSTVEHLVAALWASGLTHVRIELDGPEIPILDGSAKGWMELLKSAGRQEIERVRPLLRIQSPIWLESQGAQMMGVPLPYDGKNAQFRLTVGVNYDVPGAGMQTFDELINEHSFATELAPARTFTLEPWLEPLRNAGLIKGGSLDNAVVVGKDGNLSSPLRFENEFARHKALDCIGDLALALCPTGARFHGHVIVVRGGHGVHRDWVSRGLQMGAIVA